MTPVAFTLIFCSVMFSALGPTCFKTGVTRIVIAEGTGVLARALTMLTSPWVLLGLTCYAMGTVLWLFALRRIDLSLAYPFVAMSFVVVTGMAVIVLGEPLTLPKIIGLTLIVSGLCVMTFGT